MLRVLLAKPGLDSHDRGAKIVARALREAGMEVIYIGVTAEPRTPEEIVSSAIQEDADVIGLSMMSPIHIRVVSRIRQLMQDAGARIPIVVGGIIPDEDVPKLKELGVAGVFGPGSPLGDIVTCIRDQCDRGGS
ncbi:MAG: cobalamin B12-binding domain-containing protein [Chloroflexi bacterium]|nr:cobalamin B12-binding domain-containing protein [Chloroflexota bacterium]